MAVSQKIQTFITSTDRLDLKAMGSTCYCHENHHHPATSALIPRLMGPTWGLSGGDQTKVGPMFAP